ncbi:MAG: NAD-glutamate dehydrogenase [Comamonadaceae bacterium]|nr:NAD-glutamate dehydrogenase [Comamonadaceae bacterium]
MLRETGRARRVAAASRALPPQARALARAPRRCWCVTKANTRSTVHRPGYIDYIGIKRFDAAGRVIGEHRFLGLFTSTAYSARVRDIPLLRGKVGGGRSSAPGCRAGEPPAARRWRTSCETYPRDELFQIGDDELYDIALGILRARRAPAPAPVRAPRPVRALRLLPDLRAARELRHRAARASSRQILRAGLRRQRRRVRRAADRRGRWRASTSLVRTHAGPDAGRRPRASSRRGWPRPRAAGTTTCATRWSRPRARRAALQLFKRWQRGLPGRLPRARRGARRGAPTCASSTALAPSGRSALALYRPLGRRARALRLQGLPRAAAPVALSDSLPMLERMGVRVLDEHAVRRSRAERRAGLDARLRAAARPARRARRRGAARALFEDAFARVFDGAIENDDFNRLVLRARPAGRRGRGAARLRQVPAADRLRAVSQAYIEATLAAHPRIARMLVAAVPAARFDPARPRRRERAATQQRRTRSSRRWTTVSNLNEDRVLRQLLGADPGDAAHQLLAHAAPDGERARRYLVASSSTRRKVPGPARAAAAVRDLRLLAALRGHPPARRQGGARRAALVGPAARTSAPRCSAW